MSKSLITITDNAAQHIRTLLSGKEGCIGIKIGIKKGGCSGFKYTIDYTDHAEPSDEVVHDKGVAVVIDPKALLHVIGTEMDFVEDKFKAEFVFNNPNEKSKCGCGKSFGV